MRKSHLVLGISLLSVSPFVACNRADTDETARRAAAEARNIAGRAGEQLADSWLATKIQAQFFADDDVKARDISVSARDGVVTVAGTVDSIEAHDEAISIVRNTDGVEKVDDQLRVAVPAADAALRAGREPTPGPIGTSGIDPGVAAMYPTDDASVTTGIQAKFFRDSALKGRHIDVATQGGIVTLRGTVANDNERAQARLLAWTTHGVQRVDDVLTIDRSLEQPQGPLATTPAPQAAPSGAPAASPSTAPATQGQQAQGQAAPSAPATADTTLENAVRTKIGNAPGITVSARDGVVLLDGTVPTAAAKQRAITAARQTQGVVQVVDRLRVGRAG